MDIRANLEKELGGRQFKIGEFTPQAGCYWASRFLGPMASGLEEALSNITKMDEPDFVKLQNACLKEIRVQIGSEWYGLLNESGHVVVPEITGPELLELTITSFSRSMAPFFDQARIKGIIGAFMPLLQTLGQVTSSGSPSASSTGDSASSGTEPIQSEIFSTSSSS